MLEQRGQQEPDFLDKLIVEGEVRSPGFAAKVEDVLHRRVMERALAESSDGHEPSSGRPTNEHLPARR